MEFPGLGKHCNTPGCNQLDFLPFQCKGCKKSFCVEHIHHRDHDCPCPPADTNFVPTCPLCTQPVHVPKGMDVNRAVGRHIDQGCPNTSAKKTKECHVQGCSKHELVDHYCKDCGRVVCMKHRHSDDHQCQGNRAKAADAAARRAIAPPMPAGNSASTSKRTKKVNPKVALMKLKAKAKGFPPTLDMEKRFYIEIIAIGKGDEAISLPLFFNRSYTIGKVLDLAADAAHFTNNNNIVNNEEERLHLFLAGSSTPLPTNVSLELLESTAFYSGVQVYLVKGLLQAGNVQRDESKNASCAVAVH